MGAGHQRAAAVARVAVSWRGGRCVLEGRVGGGGEEGEGQLGAWQQWRVARAACAEALRPCARVAAPRRRYLATDSVDVLSEARRTAGLKFLSLPNVTRSGGGAGAPTRIIDEVMKERAKLRRGVDDTQREATLAALDAHLLARTHVLVGKFSSGLFRAAHMLAAARRGALPPFLSLDAPWCSDYGVPAGYNDEFPRRGDAAAVPPSRDAPLDVHSNVFLC